MSDPALEPFRWHGGVSTHHVRGSYHNAHAGTCATNGSMSYSLASLPLNDCRIGSQPVLTVRCPLRSQVNDIDKLRTED